MRLLVLTVHLTASCAASTGSVLKSQDSPPALLQELERRSSGALPQSSAAPGAPGGAAQRSAAAKAWGTLLSAYALVARHDPRPRVADTAGAALLVSASAHQVVEVDACRLFWCIWHLVLRAGSMMRVHATTHRRQINILTIGVIWV